MCIRDRLEDVADFNAATDFQCALAIRRRIADDDVTDVGNFWFRQVATEIHAGQMEARFVGTAYEIAHRGNCAVGENGHFLGVDRNRPDVARLAAEIFLDFAFGSEAEGRKPGDLARLDLVECMVDAQQQQRE